VTELAGILEGPRVQHAFYADDLVIAATTSAVLQYYLNETARWCAENALDINTAKTKVMRFGRGGSYAKADHQLKINGRPIQLVNAFAYLGVTLSPKLTFSRHIKEKQAKASAATALLGNLQEIDIKTAMNIFRIKIAPIASYCAATIAPFLSAKHLRELDKVKTSYAKRVLGLPRHASATLALQLLREKTFAEDLALTGCQFNAETWSQYVEFREERNLAFATARYTDGPVFQSEGWRKSFQKNRNVICRITAHGFHYLLCAKGCPEAVGECACILCGKTPIDRLHILDCTLLPHDSLEATVNRLQTLVCT